VSIVKVNVCAVLPSGGNIAANHEAPTPFRAGASDAPGAWKLDALLGTVNERYAMIGIGVLTVCLVLARR
jgi:hypothetical protein